MKTYWRLIGFIRPVTPFFVGYFFLSILHVIFGVTNFVMIAPLLDVLFGTVEIDQKAIDELNVVLADPSIDIDYALALFKTKMIEIIDQHGKMKALQFVCLTVIISAFFSNLFRYIQIRMKERLRAKMSKNVRAALFNKVLNMNIGFFTDQKKGDIMSRNTNDTLTVEYTITGSLALFIKEPITIIIFFWTLFSLSFELTLAAFLVLPITGGLISVLMKRLKKQATGMQEAQGNLLTMLDEAVSGLRVIKAFTGGKYVEEKYHAENQKYAGILQSFSYRRELASPLSEWTGITIVSGILLYGGYLIFSGDSGGLDASSFISYLAIFSQVTRPVKALSAEYSGLQRGIAAGDRIFALLDAGNEVQDAPDAQPLEGFNEKITFNQVGFSYDGEKQVLKGIDFEIPKGKTVALVGQSGGGKSTIADLIPRFYDVTQGEILIDGMNLKNYQMDSIHAQMGVVTQESILFNDSIFNNIAFGKPNASKEEVIQAAKIANAHEFIMATENGYDTIIGDRGSKLSGGQRQRLSIARAIFKNPPILILDEATSALDTESEKLVQHALENLMKNRTSLVIAHRLSTIQNADQILVINEGKIVERGTHQELIANPNGVYRKLTEMQSM